MISALEHLILRLFASPLTEDYLTLYALEHLILRLFASGWGHLPFLCVLFSFLCRGDGGPRQPELPEKGFFVRQLAGNKIKLNLSAIFTAAVKKEIMRRNPCKLATPPKVDTKPAEFLNEQQCHIFLQALHEQSDFQFEIICNLFLATGMRSGELCALHWEDIDLDTGLLYIQHTLVRMNGEFRRDTPKTSGSERRIVLPEYIIELLKQHKKRQALERFRAGSAWKVPDAVFTNGAGNYFIGTNLNVRLKKICRKAGLPDIHVHSLRHPYVKHTTKIFSLRLIFSQAQAYSDARQIRCPPSTMLLSCPGVCHRKGTVYW